MTARASGEEANSFSSDRQEIVVSQSSEGLVEKLLSDRLQTTRNRGGRIRKWFENEQCKSLMTEFNVLWLLKTMFFLAYYSSGHFI